MQPEHFSRRAASLGAVLLAGLLLAACASNPVPPMPMSMPMSETYRVGAPDVLAIHVLPDPEIARAVTVRPDGFVTVDLIGDVEAAGRTTTQIAEEIQQRIRRFKRDASVTVSVEAALSNVVSIWGEVGAVGTLPLTTQTRVSQAIASRGGTTFLAWESRVRVIRNSEDGTDVYRVNLKRIHNGDFASNMLLQGGDIVVVPPTPLGTFGYFVQQIVFPYQQVLGPGLAGANLASQLGAF
ncbi:MAG: polysaccharide biosynthesis/export family protein [Myxococcota bacterium]|nr:polysaccharide biosynthesis/export family protein [Myxococcota bacterium]